jgi:aminopeptidase N
MPTTITAGLRSLALLCGVAVALHADPYVRQPIDVQHYRFAIGLADSTDRISGDATIRFAILQANLAQVWFDLAGMTPARQGRGMRVSSVTRDGTPLVFRHDGDRLTITLDKAAAAGSVVELLVHYAGIPADGLQIKPTPLGDRAFFSDNWPDKGHHWLPLIDHIADKATMEMAVTAPSHYQVISNGLRVESTDLPLDMRRTVWRESVPISPWLYALGVASFAVQHVADYAGISIDTWVFAKQRDAGFYDFAVPTKDALAFYSEFIGPFSYEKLANVQSNSVAGGMEAASAIFYSAGSVAGTRPVRWRNVVIHEIAHQWFGDAVTESDWDNVWLSEGFATYFTLLFIEHAYGRDEFATGLRDSRRTVLDFDTKTPAYRVVHANLTDMANVTSAMTYQKGSWVLHMLRAEMGDDRFWTGIRDYYARHRNGNATTADFRRAMEQAAGRDLGPFFEQWLYRGGVPRLTGTWRWDSAAKQVIVELHQTQAGDPFQLPIEIGITSVGSRPRIERVSLSARDGRFVFPAEAVPAGVELDPNVRLLFDGRIEQRP